MPAILGNIIAITGIALLALLCIHNIRQGGGCAGCSGNCSEGCSLGDPEKMKRKIERRIARRHRRERLISAFTKAVK